MGSNLILVRGGIAQAMRAPRHLKLSWQCTHDHADRDETTSSNLRMVREDTHHDIGMSA